MFVTQHCIAFYFRVWCPRKMYRDALFSSPPGAENPRYSTDSRQWRTPCYSDGSEGPHRCRRTHRIHHVAPVSTPFPDDYWLLWPMHASLPHCISIGSVVSAANQTKTCAGTGASKHYCCSWRRGVVVSGVRSKLSCVGQGYYGDG